MSNKILCVDDEENILSALQRTLSGQFEIDVAVGSEQGLRKVAENGPYAVVVSDIRMPGMDGIDFLSEVKSRCPDTVRMILSGAADLECAMRAVNQDRVFQFLTKPCSSVTLQNALNLGLRQYHLIIAERELLEQTLNASVATITELLGIVSPLAFSRAAHVRSYVRHMALKLKLGGLWELELAAMLSQVGCIAVPPEILVKVSNRDPLTESEADMFRSHPSVAYSLISKIPRLDLVAEIVRHQLEPTSFFKDPSIKDVVAIGAQMLRIAVAFDEYVSLGSSLKSALKYLRDRPEMFQSRLVDAIEDVEIVAIKYQTKVIEVRDLQLGMILNEDILTKTGLFVIPKGQAVSDSVLRRLRNFARSSVIREPFSVLVPAVMGERPPHIPRLSETRNSRS